MTTNEYSRICDQILSSTIQYINTTQMKNYRFTPNPVSADIAYNNAVYESSPISLIYTPSGSGKTSLISDRINALRCIGIKDENIIVLNMNLAKTKQMKMQFPNANIMTFNDFTHNIFSVNYNCENVNLQTVINKLRLISQTDPALANTAVKFAEILETDNPQSRAVMATLFINKNIDAVINILQTAGKSTYALESMICQNTIYDPLLKNPYDNTESIIINSVQNMSIPTLCTVLQYANRYGCNLFITGSPDESIYEFNMAYGNAMNVLSSYTNKTDKKIGIIRLFTRNKMTNSIVNVLDMIPTSDLRDVIYAGAIYDENTSIQTIADITLNPNIAYIDEKLQRHEQLMIIARSKQDGEIIKQIINKRYLSKYPDLKIADLITPSAEKLLYGQAIVKYHRYMIQKYQNNELTAITFLNELYDMLYTEENNESAADAQKDYRYNKEFLKQFAETKILPWLAKKFPQYSAATLYNLNSYRADVTFFENMIFDIESKISQEYIEMLEQKAMCDTNSADIILSTIHSVIDIRCDNVIIFMKNPTDYVDKNLYRVALSRANKSEYIIFANAKPFEVPHQRYLRMYSHE